MSTIAMFSGPRNISTTVMRAFENRADTAVLDEPFYACYLIESGAPHPMRDEILRAQPHRWTDVVDALTAPAPGGEPIRFQKHIAFHFAGGAPLDWLKGARIFHLIRDPRAMVASYANKYDDLAPIIDSYRMQRIIDERAGGACPVVDARDILLNPDAMLQKLCAALDIEFDDAMLSWPAGKRDTDGVWADHWYDAVASSTGFKPYKEQLLDLTPAQEDVAAKCMADYDFFHNRRIIA